MARKRLVVSAVNLVEGGTLAVLVRFLKAATEALPEWDIVALVHKPELVQVGGIRTISFPKVKASWLRRLWFEYWQCRALSTALDADLWVALHDLTPNVRARRQAVYCHNPTPFFPLSVKEAVLEPKLLAFKILYGLVYRVNLHRNHTVILQQGWLGEEFRRRYRARNIVVAHPVEAPAPDVLRHRFERGTVFIYPALARPFKNFELICKATWMLERRADWTGEVRLTIDGSENRYAREIVERYRDCRSIKFLGLQTPTAMEGQYAEANCLLFPSLKETWGLPLSEAKARGLAIIAADLPYAHESVGDYEGAVFVNPRNAEELASAMYAFHNGTLEFKAHRAKALEFPFARNWSGLIQMLTQGL